MNDIRVEFTVSPWLLFLIMPAVGLIVAAFFLRRGKYVRCTANRVLSTVLQSLVAVLCIFALSGMTFVSGETEQNNELVLLVDRSFSARNSREGMDEFVHEILETNDGRFEIAVVLFGNGQETAVSLGAHSAEEAYAQYLGGMEKEADDSATDLASALRYVWDAAAKRGVITRPASAKVLILSDGLETDYDALGVVHSLTRDGIRVDTAFYAEAPERDVSIVDVKFPEEELAEMQTFEVGVSVYSTDGGAAMLGLTDYDETGKRTRVPPASFSLKRGLQTVKLTYTFQTAGPHRLVFDLEADDAVPENNVFHSYYDVRESSFMLILERYEGESVHLRTVADERQQNKKAVIETRLVSEMQTATAEDLTRYSEVVLFNIAAADMKEGLQSALSTYASEYGGGVFTVGGFEKEGGEIVTKPYERDPSVTVPVPHNYGELEPSPYSAMLPVTFEEYKPAVAVVFVFDRSGSMAGSMDAPVYTAAEDAKNALNLLDTRDYVGIVTLENTYQEIEPLLPMSKRERVIEAIDAVPQIGGSSTSYAPALLHAVQMLSTCPSTVSRKHIVLLSDGSPTDRIGDYGTIIEDAYADYGITLTVMTYYKVAKEFDGTMYYFIHDVTSDTRNAIKTGNMERLAEMGGGSMVLSHYSDKYAHDLEEPLKTDLRLEELEEVGMQSFHPHIGSRSDALGDLSEPEISALTLGGFFPSRARTDDGVEIPLYADTSPLYAEWNFGKGRVGSLMIDLDGYWSAELIGTETGKELLGALVSHLFLKTEEPTRAGTLSFSLSEDNFRTHVNIYGFDAEEEPTQKIVALVVPPDGSAVMKFDPASLSATRNRFTFSNTVPGTYIVYVLKVDKSLDFTAGSIASVEDIPAEKISETLRAYRTFSYSREYDATRDPFTEGQELLAGLSSRETEEGAAVYEKFVYDAETVFADRDVSVIVTDPRRAFVIAAIALFLAGIALRRFRLPRLHGKGAGAAGRSK